MHVKIVKMVFPLFALMIIFSLPVFSQQTVEQSTSTAQAQKLQTIKLKVSGITCAGDCKYIAKAVSKLNGVSSCKPIGNPSATSKFEVTFDPAVITKKDIQKKVEETPGCENPNDKPYKVKEG